MTKVKEIAEPKFYTRSDVFAAAVAAQRINGEYVKRTNEQNHSGRFANPNGSKTDPNATKLPNGSLMKVMLASDRSDIMPNDYELGEEIRSYWCSMITLVFSGDAKDFIKAAVDAATVDEISEASSTLMLVASLPSIYERNIKRNKEREQLSAMTSNSIPLDENVGENVKLHVTVIDSIYKERFGSNAVNALVTNLSGNRVVFFFDRKSWTKGSQYNLSGRIKSKGHQTTQLHYIRQLTPNGMEKDF